MSKFKFYQKNDSTEETIGVIDAKNVENAYIIASNIKRLPLEDFKKLFLIKKT